MKYLLSAIGLIIFLFLAASVGYSFGYRDGVKHMRTWGITMQEITMSHMTICRSVKFDTTFYHLGDSGKIISKNDSVTEVFTK